jgi:hypothetical protein
MGKKSKEYAPFGLEDALRSTPVPVLFRTTSAPGISAPEGSETFPVRLAVLTWEKAGDPSAKRPKRRKQIAV